MRTHIPAFIQIVDGALRFVRAALDAVNETYGSLDAYLADALDVDDDAREELRRKFVSA